MGPGGEGEVKGRRRMPVATAAELVARQRPDGSFGRQDSEGGRIVTTIFAARSLQEAGLGEEPGLSRALDFLDQAAVVDCGGSIFGTRDSVVPCYTGIVARLLVRAGRAQEAAPLLAWILRSPCRPGSPFIRRRRPPPPWLRRMCHLGCNLR